MRARSSNDVLARADMTLATQQQVASQWVCEGKTAAEWTTAIAAVRTQQQELMGKARALTMARVNADDTLDELHERTVQGLAMARAKYRRDESLLQSLRLLHATGSDRQGILDEAAAWAEAWERLPEADWNPTATNTKETFAVLRQEAETKLQALVAATAEERKARREFNEAVSELWEDCVEWYMSASAVFAEDTSEGQLVRAIPEHHARTEKEEDEAPQPPPP